MSLLSSHYRTGYRGSGYDSPDGCDGIAAPPRPVRRNPQAAYRVETDAKAAEKSFYSPLGNAPLVRRHVSYIDGLTQDQRDDLVQRKDRCKALVFLVESHGVDVAAHRLHVSTYSPEPLGTIAFFDDWEDYLSRLLCQCEAATLHPVT
jgi:hypothetical protein